MQNEIITFTTPKASISEMFRTLRTNVQFMTASSERNSILFTSTQAGDGKSWIAANLAITFAQAGKKVILVDTDMRRGRQHKMFDLNNDKGLSNYLILSVNNPENELGDYIQKTMVDNLYVITAGIVPPNPSELLTSKKMIDLINVLESLADIVIFDATPSTMVTDAMAISRYIGSTLIVATYKKTKMDVLKQIKRNIENVGGRVAGVILNRAPISKREYGKSYYYESSITTSTLDKKNWISNIFKKNKKNDVVEMGATNFKLEENKEQDLDSLLKQLSKFIDKK